MSALNNPHLLGLRLETEERVRSGSMSNRPNHHPTTASLVLSRVVHAAAAEAERELVEAEGDRAANAELGADQNASIYEDEVPDFAAIEQTFNNIENENKALISRTDMLEREKQELGPWRAILAEVNPIGDTFMEDAWYWKIYAVFRAPVFVALVYVHVALPDFWAPSRSIYPSPLLTLPYIRGAVRPFRGSQLACADRCSLSDGVNRMLSSG